MWDRPGIYRVLIRWTSGINSKKTGERVAATSFNDLEFSPPVRVHALAIAAAPSSPIETRSLDLELRGNSFVSMGRKDVHPCSFSLVLSGGGEI